MGNLEVEKKRSQAAGDVEVANFSGAIRNLDPITIEENDVWTFPKDYKVYGQKVGTGKTEYCFIEVEGKGVKRFYPSCFTKSRSVANEDGSLTGERAYASGTAAEEFRKYGSVKEGMDALKGKKCKCTKLTPVRCLRFQSTEVTTAYIPTIDLVKK